jgi:hypothetical protein
MFQLILVSGGKNSEEGADWKNRYRFTEKEELHCWCFC